MMNPVTYSPSAIARSGATRGFVELCKVLYGDAIDPEMVWDDVMKTGPDQADLNAHQGSTTRRRVLEGVALGSTIAGGVLGAKEGVHGVRQVMSARKAGTLIPRSAYRSLTLAGAATGGDAITTGVLASDKHKHTTSKGAGLVPLRRVVEGHVKQMGALVPTGSAAGKQVIQGQVISGGAKDLGHMKATSHTASMPAPGAASAPKKPSRAYQAGYRTGRVLKTPEGRTGLAAGAVLGSGATAAAKRPKSGGEDYYAKADDEVVFKGVFSEIDEDQRTAFGWASVTELGGKPVVDRQGDYITTEDIEKAAYEYVHKSRVGGDMHRRTPSLQGDSAHKVSDMIESVVFTDEKIAKMGLPDDFPRGWWVGFKIHDDETWNLVKSGERTGFSIHGKGIRREHSLDSVMGY